MSLSFQQNALSGASLLAELRGDAGMAAQIAAHRALGNYLYVVAYNYLRRRQALGQPVILHSMSAEELAALAQDFVQDTLMRMARDQFAVLQQYGGHGAFTAWCARMVTNLIASELRRAHWQRAARSPVEEDADPQRTPEQVAQIGQIGVLLHRCLEMLDDRRRYAFEQCIGEDRRARDVAAELETTENGVNQLVFRARHALRACLQRKGVDADVLLLFDG